MLSIYFNRPQKFNTLREKSGPPISSGENKLGTVLDLNCSKLGIERSSFQWRAIFNFTALVFDMASKITESGSLLSLSDFQ